MKIDIKSFLTKQRTDILKQMVEVATKDRKPAAAESIRLEMEHLITQLDLAEKAIVSINPPVDGKKYGNCIQAIEAILLYLEEIDQPATEEEIAKAVLAGGFRANAPGAAMNVNRSFRNFLTGTGASKQRIKERNGLIGLFDWDDSRFEPNR